MWTMTPLTATDEREYESFAKPYEIELSGLLCVCPCNAADGICGPVRCEREMDVDLRAERRAAEYRNECETGGLQSFRKDSRTREPYRGASRRQDFRGRKAHFLRRVPAGQRTVADRLLREGGR